MGVSQSGPRTRHFRWNLERFDLPRRLLDKRVRHAHIEEALCLLNDTFAEKGSYVSKGENGDCMAHTQLW